MSFPYLLKLGAKYYFRLRVPNDVVERIGLPEIKRCLFTSNAKLAKSQAAAFLFRAEQLFCLLRSGFLADADIPTYLLQNFPSKRKRPEKSPVMLVSDAVRAYLKEKSLMGSWTAKTTEENTAILNRFVELVHDCPVGSVDRRVMVDFVALLSKLPANVRKHPKYKGLTFEEVAALPDVVPMTSRSVNKYLNRIGGLFIWCEVQGYVERNPSQGLSMKRTENPYEEREAYDPGDLQRLVDSLLSVPYSNPERFWIPLIALFSGLRQNEICQLHVKDIVEVDGITCFDINADQDKNLKSLSSKRLVPVHPQLVSLGFLDYKNKLEATEERLWPNLITTRDGYIRHFVNWYYRHNRRHITKNPKRTFHSLRHTFADCLKQRGVNEGVISELMGHSNRSITTGRYGKRYRPGILLEAIFQLEYGVDFSRLSGPDNL